MKKIFAVLLVLILLVGCGQSGTPTPSEKKRVALLVGSLGDFSFNDSANEGVIRAGKDFSDKVEVKVIEYGTDESKLEAALLEAAEEGGYDMIIAASGMKTWYAKHAADFPDIMFVLFDETMDYEEADYANVHSILYKANEAAFLAGVLSAKVSETGIIGFLGGQDLPIINDFLIGYIEGAQAVNKDIKVAHSFVGSWSDSPKGKEQSIAMLNQGADVLFGVAGGSGIGAIEAGVENNIPVIGVDSDQSLLFEAQGQLDKAEIILTSALKNVGDSLYNAIEQFLDGELKGGEAANLGIKEGGVGLAVNRFFEANVSAEIRAEIDDYKEKVVNGDIVVTSAFGKTTAEINDIRNSVKP